MGQWRVEVFRTRLLQLGTVKAPNAQEALLQARNLFRIDTEDHKRLTITKVQELKPKRMLLHSSRGQLIG